MKKIYNPLYMLMFLSGILAYSTPAIAQVSPRDSAALVSLYNTTGAASWTTHTNWLSGNVSTWYGVTVNNNRISRVNLPSNNLTGVPTDSLRNLDSLVYLNLSVNALTGFPSLIGLHLDTLNLAGNKLTFNSLVPSKAAATVYFYAPQDSVDSDIDTTVTEQSNYTLTTTADTHPSIDDNYQWLQNGSVVASSPANSYTLTCMDSSKAGIYTCAITNLQLTGLTIYRRQIDLHIARLAAPDSSFHVCDSSNTLTGRLPAGGSILWTLLSGSGTIANDTSAITSVTHLGIGADVFQYNVSAGNISCPAGTYSTAQLTITRDTNPSPAYAGADQSICGVQATLNALTPSAGVGTWTVTGGGATVGLPHSASTQVVGLTSGQNIFRWQIVNGACAPAFFDEVIVFKDDTLLAAAAGVDTSICPTNYTLTTAVPANTHWAWSVVTGAATFSATASTQTFFNDTTETTTITNLGDTVNTLQWTLSNSCNSVSSNIKVTVYPFTIANAGTDQNVYYSPINAYTLGDTVATGSGGNGQYTYVWSPSSNLDSADVAHPKFLTPDTGTYSYSVTVTDGHGCTASASVSYHVSESKFLPVPTLFTPNGDGLNDELYIAGIESYPNNELTVVDRNDQVVYKKQGYKNDWQGINELGFSQQGQKLPADTYFYTLKLEDGKATQTGFFLIKY